VFSTPSISHALVFFAIAALFAVARALSWALVVDFMGLDERRVAATQSLQSTRISRRARLSHGGRAYTFSRSKSVKTVKSV
jgi:hypothetical protein